MTVYLLGFSNIPLFFFCNNKLWGQSRACILFIVPLLWCYWRGRPRRYPPGHSNHSWTEPSCLECWKYYINTITYQTATISLAAYSYNLTRVTPLAYWNPDFIGLRNKQFTRCIALVLLLYIVPIRIKFSVFQQEIFVLWPTALLSVTNHGTLQEYSRAFVTARAYKELSIHSKTACTRLASCV